MQVAEKIQSLEHLSQVELVGALDKYIGTERRLLGCFILYLIEFDRRKIFRDVGFSSSYQWMTSGLGLSESSAVRRMNAARIMVRYPHLAEKIFSKIMSGQLSVMVLSMIFAHMNNDNCDELIENISGKNRLEVEKFLANRIEGYHAMQSTRAWMRILPGPSKPSESSESSEISRASSQRVQNEVVLEAKSNQMPAPAAPATQVPGPAIRLAVTLVGEGARDLLRLREIYPYRDPSQIINDALCLMRKARDLPASRVPKAIQRQIFARDGHQCTFVSDDGRRCSERGRLQIDHILPVAKGGDDRPENLRLLCAAHNQLMAERHFGKDFMRNKIISSKH
jgi:5-methylcytosine-specific restriction endonuclease McrA